MRQIELTTHDAERAIERDPSSPELDVLLRDVNRVGSDDAVEGSGISRSVPAQWTSRGPRVSERKSPTHLPTQ